MLYISYYVTIQMQSIEYHAQSQVFKISPQTYFPLRVLRALENQKHFSFQATFFALEINTFLENKNYLILDYIHHFLTNKCH